MKSRATNLLYAAIAIVLVAGSALDATAAVLQRIAPETVLAFKPGDAQALTRAVDRRVLRDKIAPPSAADAARLREALRAKPLSVSILRQLAMASDTFARTERSGELLDLSHRVSRRDLLAELLLSERAGRTGDADLALRHFNAALSSTSRANALLFPPLAKTLANAPFHQAIGRYLASPWAPAFLDYAVRVADPRDLLATVVKNPVVQDEEKYRRFRGDLVVRLFLDNAPKAAIDYAALLPERDRRYLGDVGFSRGTTDASLGPLYWRLSSSAGVFAELAGDAVAIDVDPAANGRALERAFVLAPRRYEISAAAKVIDSSEGLSGEWIATCLADGATQLLAQQTVVLSATGVRTSFPIKVGAACRAVSVSLMLRNADVQNDAQIEISRFAIDPRGA